MLKWRTIEHATTKRTDEGDCVTTEKMLIKGWKNNEDFRIIDKGVMVNRKMMCIPVKELSNTAEPSLTWEDIREIHRILDEIDDGSGCRPYPRKLYEETLRRFNEQKRPITPCGKIRPGSVIRIDNVYSETSMFQEGIDLQAMELKGKIGTVTHINGGCASGTWGSLSVLLDQDTFTVIKY